MVGTEQSDAAGSHLFVLLLGRSIHPCSDGALLVGLDVATLVLNLKEEFPSLLCDACGEVLNVVGATCGVYHVVEVGLVLEQELHVASDALGELIATSVGVVEGAHLQRVYTSDGGTHSLGGAAEHIHIGIVDGLVPHRGNSVEVNLLCAAALGLVGLHNVGPQQACCTEFCNLHKVVGGDGGGEADALCGSSCAHALLHKPNHVVVACGQHIAQLLNDGRATVAQQRAINAHKANVFPLGILLDVACEFLEAGSALVASAAEGAVGRKAPHNGVEVERDAGVLFAELCGPSHHGLNNPPLVLRAEYNLVFGGVDACQQNVHLLCGEFIFDVEANAAHTAFDCVESLCVSLGCIVHANGLEDFPPVAVLHTANIGELSCCCAEPLNVLQILCTIVGAYIKALCCAPHQFLLVVGTFEVGCDDGLPSLGGDFGELLKQPFKLVVCHNF